MRHAQAESGADDFKRRLSREGKEDSEKMAQFLYACKWHINQIRVSPLFRSYETGKHLAEVMGKLSTTPTLEPIEDDRLKPGEFSGTECGQIKEILSSHNMIQTKQSCI